LVIATGSKSNKFIGSWARFKRCARFVQQTGCRLMEENTKDVKKPVTVGGLIELKVQMLNSRVHKSQLLIREKEY
jgi:hypothetical protein